MLSNFIWKPMCCLCLKKLRQSLATATHQSVTPRYGGSQSGVGVLDTFAGLVSEETINLSLMLTVFS